jgi:hypothetical protein
MAKKPSKTWFYETTLPDTRNEMTKYTLKKRNHVVDGYEYKSLHQIYVNMEDVTEYEFALATFGDYSVWENLCTLGWFKEHHLQMQKELRLKVKARTVRKMLDDLNEGTASYNAQKYLADGGFIEGKETKKRGRPSKDEVEGYLLESAKEQLATKEDATRIGLLN